MELAILEIKQIQIAITHGNNSIIIIIKVQLGSVTAAADTDCTSCNAEKFREYDETSGKCLCKAGYFDDQNNNELC